MVTGSLRAAIYTYEIRNVPSVQSSSTLVGNITVDTTGGVEDSNLNGNFFVAHSAIIAWNFTVTPSGGGSPCSGSSTGINASATGSGGVLAMYATTTTLSLVSGATLTLGSDITAPGARVDLAWLYDTPLYFAGGVAVGGATSQNADRGALDAAFPTNPDASASNWTIATAIPEPGVAGLLAFGDVAWGLFRRRPSQGRG